MSKRDCIFVVLDMQRLAVRPCCCRVTTPERREVRMGFRWMCPGSGRGCTYEDKKVLWCIGHSAG